MRTSARVPIEYRTDLIRIRKTGKFCTIFYEDAVMIRVKVEEVLGDSEAWVHYIDFGNR
jgi:hypothetical protein